jgi:Tfp pilus assembly protein PilF
MLSRIAHLILIVCSAASLLPAQVTGPVTGMGGSGAQLIVRLTYENDRTTPEKLRVELVSAYGSIVETQSTQGLGSVSFSHVNYGRYILRVIGMDGSRTQTEPFEIGQGNEAVHTEFVRVKSPPAEPSGSRTTEAAIDMNAPPKAKKELERGNGSLEAKSWADAKDHFERAIELYPQYASAHTGLGTAYVYLGQGEKAVTSFQEALKLDEHQTAANVYLGQFYYDNHKFVDATPYLQRAAAAQPGNPQILTALANADLKTGKLDDALANARKVHAIADHKKFAVCHLIAAEVLSSRGQNAEVIEQYKLFLQEDPKSPLAPRVHDALAKIETAQK